MAGNKLRQLSEQIDFLTTLEQDSLDECFQEYGSLMLFLEKLAAKEGNPDVCSGIEMIRNVLAENRDKILADYENDLTHLTTQKQIVAQALSIKDEQKLAQIEEIIIEEVGDLSNNDEFKTRVGQANQEMRQEFLQMINEIKEILEEGGIDELAAFFEASSLEEDEEESDEADDSSDENATKNNNNSNEDSEDDSSDEDADFDEDDETSICRADLEEGAECTCSETFDLASNDKIVDFLKQYAEPFFVDKKQENS